jgi:hypothetical protein
MNHGTRVFLAIILGDPDWFEILGVGFLGGVGGERGEAVVIVIVMVPAGRSLLLASMMPRASRPSLICCLRSMMRT